MPEFLAAMAERQRIRRRDGARHWTLLRDLEDPELWIESYQTADLDRLRPPQPARAPRPTPTSATASAPCTRGPDRPHVRRRLVRQVRGHHVAHPHSHAPLDPH